MFEEMRRVRALLALLANWLVERSAARRVCGTRVLLF